jgi:hypothetical protein
LLGVAYLKLPRRARRRAKVIGSIGLVLVDSGGHVGVGTAPDFGMRSRHDESPIV